MVLVVGGASVGGSGVAEVSVFFVLSATLAAVVIWSGLDIGAVLRVVVVGIAILLLLLLLLLAAAAAAVVVAVMVGEVDGSSAVEVVAACVVWRVEEVLLVLNTFAFA